SSDLVALAHQHARRAAIIAHEDERCRIARAHGGRRSLPILLVARILGVEHPFLLLGHDVVPVECLYERQDACTGRGLSSRRDQISGSPPNPCIRAAHCQPTTAPLMRGRSASESSSVTAGQTIICTHSGGR